MENSDFQKTVADQRATKELLTKALDVLKKVPGKETLPTSCLAIPNIFLPDLSKRVICRHIF